MDRMNHGRHRAGGAKRAVQKPETAASQTTLPNRPAVTSLRRSDFDRAEESNRAGPCRPPFSGLLRCPRRSRRKSTVAGRRASQSGVVDGLSEFGTEQDRCRGSIRTEWVCSRESQLVAPVALRRRRQERTGETYDFLAALPPQLGHLVMAFDQMELQEPLIGKHSAADDLPRRIPPFICVWSADRKLERRRRCDAHVRVVCAVVRLERCQSWVS